LTGGGLQQIYLAPRGAGELVFDQAALAEQAAGEGELLIAEHYEPRAAVGDAGGVDRDRFTREITLGLVAVKIDDLALYVPAE